MPPASCNTRTRRARRGTSRTSRTQRTKRLSLKSLWSFWSFDSPGPPAPQCSPVSEPAMTEPLSSVDHAWLRMDEPTNLMVINGVLVLDQPMDFARLREVMEKRLTVLPRFRQKVVADGGRPRWVEDRNFNLDTHLVRVTLAAPGGDDELREVINSLMSAPLDPSRPLWIFHSIDNYKGGSVLFGQLHHAIGDGVALML